MIARSRQITRSHVQKHCDYYFTSLSRKWAAWAWQNVVFLRLAGTFTKDEADQFMGECWSIFQERKFRSPVVYVLADANDFEVQAEEIRTYLKTHWAHLLERNDLLICLIVGKSMKAIIWHSIHLLMGTRNRIRIFSTHGKAFQWLSRRLRAEVGA